jgi:benzoyl-CoA reductase/2-hydroxyglutaryl-CoA dehydratase subunit BcrC/BadD/HgdB
MNEEQLRELQKMLQYVEITAYIVRAHVMDLNFKTEDEREIMYKAMDRCIGKLVKVRNKVITEEQLELELDRAELY